MQRQGFKAFNKDMTNQYGLQFKEQKTYQIPDHIPLTKGVKGTGFHYTPYLEDTLRYVEGLTDEIKIAQVTAIGEVITFDDEYNGYYDISAARKLTINHILTREEIINHMLTKGEFSILRFIKGYKLTPQEIEQITNKFKINPTINLAIDYYQNNDHEAYQKYYHSPQKIRRF